ncbi:SAV_915 family protein [Streptomyces fructofermentans]|uniref:SAV_915 family protein n=1 Tax=Streptomyces fructofermentans TaxID=152141 RepID=UPI0033CADAF5
MSATHGSEDEPEPPDPYPAPADPAPGDPSDADPPEHGPSGPEPSAPGAAESLPVGLLHVPVRTGPAGGRTVRFFRTPLGDRTAVGFTSPAGLAGTLGAYQESVRLSEPALRALAGPLGVRSLIVDPRFSAPPARLRGSGRVAPADARGAHPAADGRTGTDTGHEPRARTAAGVEHEPPARTAADTGHEPRTRTAGVPASPEAAVAPGAPGTAAAVAHPNPTIG